MRSTLFPNRLRAFALWTCLLLICTGASIGANLFLARYAQTMRENDPDVHLSQAEALMNEGDFTGAMTELGRAYARNPEHPRYYQVMGAWQFNRKEWTAAIKSYQRAMELGSNELGVKVNTLWALIELEKYNEAVRFGKACIDSGNTAPYFPRYIAEALVRDEKEVEAIPYLEAALRNNKNDLYLMGRLTHAYEQSDQKDRAENMRNNMRRIETRLGEQH